MKPVGFCLVHQIQEVRSILVSRKTEGGKLAVGEPQLGDPLCSYGSKWWTSGGTSNLYHIAVNLPNFSRHRHLKIKT